MEPTQYFRHYRNLLGFSNQKSAKDFLGAKDIVPAINFAYIDTLLKRIENIVESYSKVITHAPKPSDLQAFCQKTIQIPYQTIKANNLLPRLNNQGRRPESVLFSWLRGYATAEYFLPSLARIFDSTNLESIGDDDFTSIETFRRTPKADFLLKYRDRAVRVEVQTGYQNVNDIKQHKILEAKRVFRESNTPTICTHFDIFNGQAAFVRLDTVSDHDVNWIIRQQMEGQTVFTIDQNSFVWRLTKPPPSLADMDFDL